MPRYKVRATYTVTKTMEIGVESGDPKDPANWVDITDEQDVDCALYDVESAEELPCE